MAITTAPQGGTTTTKFRTTKFRTTLAALAALAAFSTTGVASAAVPGALGDTPMTVKPTSEASGGTTAPLATPTTDAVVSETPTVAPAAPTHIAQVFRPDPKVCKYLQTQYQANIEGAVQIEGNPDGRNPSDKDAAASDQAANETREDAKQAGCSWAK